MEKIPLYNVFKHLQRVDLERFYRKAPGKPVNNCIWEVIEQLVHLACLELTEDTPEKGTKSVQIWRCSGVAIFSNVSNFDFEQVNAAWEEASRMRKLSLTKYSLPEIINIFIAIVPIFSPLKTPVNHWFSGVHSGYKMGTLARKVLNIHDNYFSLFFRTKHKRCSMKKVFLKVH